MSNIEPSHSYHKHAEVAELAKGYINGDATCSVVNWDTIYKLRLPNVVNSIGQITNVVSTFQSCEIMYMCIHACVYICRGSYNELFNSSRLQSGPLAMYCVLAENHILTKFEHRSYLVIACQVLHSVAYRRSTTMRLTAQLQPTQHSLDCNKM